MSAYVSRRKSVIADLQRIMRSGFLLQPGKRAACAGGWPRWDHDQELEVRQRAARVCGGCPLQEQCLQVATTHGLSGVWGGADLVEGRPRRGDGGRRRRAA